MTDAGRSDPDGVRNVMSGLAHIAIQSQSIGQVALAVPEPKPVPFQIPATPAHFTDRTAESSRLDELLAAPRPAGSPMRVLVTGVGGIGKTATVTRWAHSVRDRFPDGQLYADLGDSPTVNDVPRHILFSLGVDPEVLPAGAPERRALFRSLTTGRRLLVFLDNVTSAAQAAPLTPASSDSAVIMTSRAQRPGLLHDGAVPLPLEPLPAQDAVAMLAAMVGPDRAEREARALAEVATLCGRWPLALRIAGAQLLSRPRRPAARLAEDLRARGVSALAGEPIVRAVFDEACGDLTDQIRAALRPLSVIPGPDFCLDVAAVALDLSAADAEPVLDALIEAGLLHPRGDRYRFHDLVARYARERAEEEEDASARDAVVGRVVDWYLVAAVAADHTDSADRLRVPAPGVPRSGWDPPFHTPRDALAWMDGERDNLVAALRAAADREWDERVWPLAQALWPLFLKLKHYQDWVDCYQRAVRASARLGDRRAEARMRCLLGRGYLELEEYDRADAEYSAALDAARDAGDRAIEASTVEFIGRLRFERRDYAGALEAFTRSLAMHEDLGDRRGGAIQTHHLARAQWRSGQPVAAVETLGRALELAAAVNDEYNQGRVLISLAEVYRDVGRLDLAAAAATRAVDIMRGHSWFQVAVALEVLGDVTERAGDAEAATGYLRQAARTYQAVGSPKAAGLWYRLSP